MFKKLDLLVIRSFIGPFLATFLIAMFVLVMQFFWLYIDDLVGKGLEFSTLSTLIGLVAISWVPLALPLSLLLSSIMTFGNLGEHFELVAIKSAGISLIRFIRPLFLFSCMIAGIAFLIANYVIPIANLKLNALKVDIIRTKPALDIKVGTFYNKIEGYIIKIGYKDPNGTSIKDIVIFEKNHQLQDNLIIAKTGDMGVSADKQYLIFTLHDGWYYEEKGEPQDDNPQFIRFHFKEYEKYFDLSSFKMIRTQDSIYKNDYQMLNVKQLGYLIDSLSNTHNFITVHNQYEINSGNYFINYKDSTTYWRNLRVPKPVFNKTHKINTIIPDTMLLLVNSRAQQIALQLKNSSYNLVSEYEIIIHNIDGYKIEWQRKFALSFACIVLFLIGAPLGSIIRKGGLGAPMVFAIIFFSSFHLLNSFGEKLAKDGSLSPFTGMWLASIILTPIALFLVYKATRDSTIMNKDFYYKLVKPITKLFSQYRKTKKIQKK